MEQAQTSRIFYFIITIVLVLMTQYAYSYLPCSGRHFVRFEHNFLGTKNRILREFAYENKTIPYLIICARECNMDKECKSFNFKSSNICELNHVTQTDHPEDFFEEQDGMYFDSDGQTTLFSWAQTTSLIAHSGSCKTLMKAGFCSSGAYTINPNGFVNGLKVYCDMETDGGGWIVFQRRQDGRVDFYRNWDEYETGFGNLSGEFWLGNANLLKLTSDDVTGAWELRVDLGDWENNTAWAKYKDFKISGSKYALSIGKYDANSTAGDALERQNGRAFTTKDNENDIWDYDNCAEYFHGAWWFSDCTDSHLNGKYLPNGRHTYFQGIKWDQWIGKYFSLKQCSIKMRELH